jgi:hypothetical protein
VEGSVVIDLPDVHFGDVTDEPNENWKDLDEADPDDEELEQTPQSVIDMLGFDPKEPDEDDVSSTQDA